MTKQKPGPKLKLSAEDCAEIRRMYYVIQIPTWSAPQIARSFNVSVGTIHKVLSRKPPYKD
jgi:hypothetical protein